MNMNLKWILMNTNLPQIENPWWMNFPFNELYDPTTHAPLCKILWTPRPHGWRFSWSWLPNEVCMGKINQPLAIGTAYGWHLVGTNFDDDDNEDPPGDEEAY